VATPYLLADITLKNLTEAAHTGERGLSLLVHAEDKGVEEFLRVLVVAVDEALNEGWIIEDPL
jgi:hypothetical protein